MLLRYQSRYGIVHFENSASAVMALRNVVNIATDATLTLLAIAPGELDTIVAKRSRGKVVADARFWRTIAQDGFYQEFESVAFIN